MRISLLSRLLFAALFLLVAGAIPACSCDSNGSGPDDGAMAGDDSGISSDPDAGDDLSGAVVVPSTDGGCTASGASCGTSADCCSGLCDANHLCVAGMCAPDGADCKVATDCCKLNCTSGKCSAAQCVTDNAACTAGGAPCCSTQCVNGSCKPLSTTCKTAGNACPNGNGDCCSNLCTGGFCASPSQISYCTQPGDICFRDNDCCTGVCAGATATNAGVCATISSGCAVDGTTCNGCGGCCSSFCAPFGTSTSKICQPASGCHVLGDLCKSDTDCCGGDVSTGLPGAGLVKCIPNPTYPQIGTCGMANPNNCTGGAETCKNTCQPEGDVCHFLGNGGCSSNSFPNNCCGAPGNKGMCQLDKLGVPRCYGLGACVMTGGSCASAADCCMGLPCLPDAMGHLKCGSMSCVPAGGTCTTTSDCCAGLPCSVPPGSLKGTCTTITTTPPPDLGTAPADLAGVDLAGVDLATPPSPDLSVPACSLYGQSCTSAGGCCVNNGTCLTPYPVSAPCTAGDTSCTCYTPLM
jgi:hypothetical protein